MAQAQQPKVFTEQQIARYRRVFNMFDINKDGVLEAREIAAVAKVLGYHLPKEQLFAILTRLDLDENGVLTFDEFIKVMPGNTVNIPQEDHRSKEEIMSEKFKEYDKDGDGFVSQSEAHAVLKTELAYTEEHTRALVSEYDKDEDGQLSFDEFVGFHKAVEAKRAEIRQKFLEYDKNGDGYVSKEEAHEVLKRELGFTEDKSRILLSQYDVNVDNQLSYDEFVAFYLKVVEKKEAINQAFQQFDREGKGYVSMEDAQRVLGGLLFSDEEIQSLVNAHDTNKDGKLQYDEFVHFWSC